MHRTNLGRMVHAIGDNPRAAQLAGAPVNRVRILAFVISSLTATDGLVELADDVTEIAPGQTIGFLPYAVLTG